MSRRKQAKPRSLKRDDEWDDEDGNEDGLEQEEEEDLSGEEQDEENPANQDDASHISEGKEEDWIEEETIETNGDVVSGTPLDDVGDDSVDSFESGNSSRLEHLIEKIQANKENHEVSTEEIAKEALGTTPGSSWRSSTPEGGSPESARSGGSPASERELSFTLGTTEHTPYQCQFCDKAFPRLSYLKKHEQTHSDQMPFRCDYCSRLFKHKRSRDRHVKLHTGDRKYRCSHCEAAFSRSDHLKIHMKTHDNQKPFQCTICNRGYNTAAALTSHMQNHKRATGNGDGSPASHHGVARGYRCLHCGERFRRPDLLQAHTSSVHGNDMSTTSSPRAASTPTTPSPRPRSSAHSVLPPKYTCMYCTRDTFSTMEQLQAHVHTMHGTLLNTDLPLLPPPLPPPSHPDQNGLPQIHSPSVLPYNCESCTMRFPTSSALHQHVASTHSKHSPRSPLTCSVCSIPFSSTAGLAEHFLMAHGSPPEQLRPTDLSKKTFDRPSKRPRSGEDTLGAGTLLCNQCGAALPDFESFRIHLRAHIEGGAYLTCSTCGSRFTDPAALERHTAAHLLSLGAEFGCPSCSRAFSKPDELQKHLMDLHAHHLYRCTICKEIFDSKVAIQVHFAVKHSHECKVYKCTACNSSAATFRSEAEFTLHVRAQHSATQNTPLATTTRCPYCRATCATELELQFHLAAHAEQYRCPLCREGFHVEFLLDRHMQQHHQHQGLNGSSPKPKQSPNRNKILPVENNNTKKEATSCDICDRNDFQSESELVAHRKLSHHIKTPGKNGAVSLSCAYCSENCKTRSELENHMKTHSQSGSSGGKHKCLICDEVFPSAAVLAEHKLTHCKVLGGNNCTHCKATIANEEQFFSHLSQHSNNNNNSAPNSPRSPPPLNLPSPCVICRQTLMTDIEARIHARFHLKNSGLSTEMYQCALCLKSYTLREVIPTGAEINNGIPTTYVCKDCYRQHSGTADPSDDRRCNECHLKFESNSALEIHIEEVHRKTYTCIECQAAFKSEQEVRAHVQTHITGSGSLECRLCRRSLGSPLQLQAHLIEHTFAGCGAFTCYLCSAVFTGASGLQQHMLAHGLSARPYDCNRCGLKFFFRAELDNHSYTHLEDDVRIKLSDAVDNLKHPYFLGQNGFHNIDSLASCYSTQSPSLKKIKTSESPLLYKTTESPADFINIMSLQNYKQKIDSEKGNNTNNEIKTDEQTTVKQEIEEKDEYIEVSSPINTTHTETKNDPDIKKDNINIDVEKTILLSPKKEIIDT